MRTYNEKVVKGMSREQFLEQHPEAGADYDKIVGVKEKVLRKVTRGWLDKHPEITDIEVGDMYLM